MVIKSYNKETGETVGDCAKRFPHSWELHQDGDVFTLKIDGQKDEILEWSERELYYYIAKKEKRPFKLLLCNQLRHWMFTQWQSGDVWSYAPYLTKLERDMLVYGNAQWTALQSIGD